MSTNATLPSGIHHVTMIAGDVQRTLGESLVLPPWLEPRRAALAASLPPIALPSGHATPFEVSQ